jgi:hypothetical protein
MVSAGARGLQLDYDEVADNTSWDSDKEHVPAEAK